MNTENGNIKSSGEDYLEAILMIQNRHSYARSIELAQQLNVTNPSVSVAVHALEKKGYHDGVRHALHGLSLQPDGKPGNGLRGAWQRRE